MADIQILGVVGAGAMGRGIAQIAAQAGIKVRLYDNNAAAVAAARDALAQTWDKLAQKGKMSAEAVKAALDHIQPAQALADLADCQLVVEAIVERLDVKRDLFSQLESIVGPDCILASNTSSLSITAIAAACQRPGRVAGFHFFNPVPLMKVVEVIDGLRSAPAVGDALAALARRMGHTPVRAKDMPGFIVNHAGRGMNTEGLRAAQEAVAPFDQIDAIMREQAGFRMGPFELMDLTGLDVSHPVMESIYGQFFDEPRFRPSPITTVRLAGGLLGRKAGEGFYVYQDGQKQVPAEPAVPALPQGLRVWVSAAHADGQARAQALLRQLGAEVVQADAAPADALLVVTPLGEDVSSCVAGQGLDGTRTVGLDVLHDFAASRRRTVMTSPATTARWRDAAHALFAKDGVAVSVIEDSPGFIAQRVVATIVNIACDIAQQHIATPGDIDQAVNLGLGYPKGPLAMGDALGAARILEILRNMERVTGDPRYRPSLWLQRRVQLGLPLAQA
ncbi:3-hydroxyacyl-CoA dehydrogenase [Bordetella hinzii]|uniref:3-hydroxyacyl-CoA dehydrogenase n=5 Tax=Bordetella hinzii TaxID=103855 RepID=A0AAN1VG00_9BORD|nr:3-hydroxyacyl-CoA dehydrogenase [Bordetella hinzii]AKQ57579.1 3-hydroxyadipyl-CoA dehydrogenase [Bordetella hinzii]AKQ62045.1 3-hydroxyadipyl-CoA dehydrogenase [Bordetella hinzii]AZW17037.1 3-hydroxyacyl-CoA dehydrogenase [Bordetella hinzii]KCB22797.1 3-hydroxyacyl-CoA dehydrogenase, NAD binding domain protein [Bordetella hinzii OH87 BAL007II]KCB42140.1 3-hydroxyacyl-CoA dehydrogenase, NAD binding domain protein [Bordetella hinzii 4161]